MFWALFGVGVKTPTYLPAPDLPAPTVTYQPCPTALIYQPRHRKSLIEHGRSGF